MAAPKSKKGGADAHKHASFGSNGGEADGFSKPTKGVGSGGGNVYHSAPKSKENIKPPNAHAHDSFSGNQKAPKSGQEY